MEHDRSGAGSKEASGQCRDKSPGSLAEIGTQSHKLVFLAPRLHGLLFPRPSLHAPFRKLGRRPGILRKDAQRLPRHLAFDPVRKGHDRPDDLPVFANRRADVFDGKGLAVLGPEDFMVDRVHRPVLERGVDGTFRFGIGASVRFGVVQEPVRGLSKDLGGLPPQHRGRRRVEEGGMALGIQPVEADPGRVEDQVVGNEVNEVRVLVDQGRPTGGERAEAS